MKLFDKIFGTYSERELKRIQSIVDEVNSKEYIIAKLSDEMLKHKTIEFKNRLNNGETLDDILPEAYAVVRETSKRVLGLRHYDVQIIGGIILHQGRIAEMLTGEGKTLVAALPSYLNALTGNGVHVVTVNDYLAKRDAEEIGQIHRFLGLTVGCVTNDLEPISRKQAYNCDIMYITNNELGFDYLRDNMVGSKDGKVQREFNYCIIDEVDSVLIDEARTPLIISGKGNKPTTLYQQCDFLAKKMKRGKDMPEMSKMDIIMGEYPKEDGDFIVDEKHKNVTLTENGVKKVEEFFKIKNLADPENLEIQHGITIALRANNLMFKDQHYIINEKQEIMIVDEFTGRIMNGRRYSDGLHQAIEAKENVPIKQENKTLATITLQNFFNKYKKKAGMTGTALTEEQEFKHTYGLDVVSIPPHQPVIRKDLDDIVYMTQEEKYKKIIDEIVLSHEKNQPVLVGTITIETSELLSKMLSKKGVKHSVLNAKYHEKEAEIISHAGEAGAVTIATNMAGRGTDIKLDEEAKAAGGLRVIGTERHDSRRIDNQLRGRSGRQGDPGESQFFISLEDNLMRFGNSKAKDMLSNMEEMPKDVPVQSKFLSNIIETAQKRIESNHFGIRKNLLEYDNVMNEQREIIYEERNKVLNGENMKNIFLNMVKTTIENNVNCCIFDDQDIEDWNVEELNKLMQPIFSLNEIKISENMKKDELIDVLTKKALEKYEEKEKEFPTSEDMRNVERLVLLRAIDIRWMNHIDDMEQIRQGIGLQAYAQKDPLIEYKMISYDVFNEMMDSIKKDSIYMIYNIKVQRKENNP